MAFESDLSSKLEIYARPFPDVNRHQWTVSTSKRKRPRESFRRQAETQVSTLAKWKLTFPISAETTPEVISRP